MLNQNLLLASAASLAIFLAGCSSKPTPPATEAPKAAIEPKSEEVAAAPTHAIAGTVEEIGPNGSYLIIKSSDGTTHRVETTPQTEVHGHAKVAGEPGKRLEEVSKDVVKDVKKGTMVAVHYSEKEGKLVAHKIGHLYSETVKTSEVVIHKVGDTGEKVFIKTKKGTEEAYDVSKKAVVTSGKKISEISKVVADKTVEGTKATVHYTEEAGRKVIHFIEHK
jgi:hypothetical protein